MDVKIIKPNINKLERKKDVEGLIKVLGVPRLYEIDDKLHSDLVKALGRIGGPAIEPLVKAILEITKTASYRGVTIYARDIRPLYDALAKIGEPGIDSLVKLLCEDLYSYAKEALAKIGEPAIEPLVEILKDTDDWRLIGRISKIFKNIGKPAVKPLIEIIKSKGEKKTLLAAIKYDSYANKVFRTFCLEKVYDETIPNSEKVTIGVIHTLMTIGKPAVGPLINVLGDPKKEVCVEAIYILEGIDDPLAVEVMRRLDREYEEQEKTNGIYI